MELLNEEQREALAKIHIALERIERGIFGACEDCGQRISEERLSTAPWDLKCVHCEVSVTPALPASDTVSVLPQ